MLGNEAIGTQIYRKRTYLVSRTTMSSKSNTNKGSTSISDDGQRTTKIRNSINVPSLVSWMVHQPALITLFGGTTALSSQLENRLTIRQFGFGQSNPTYLLTIKHTLSSQEDDDASAGAAVQLVLRRKPNKVAHKTAHALHREYRVLESLTRYNQQLLKEEEEQSIAAGDDDDNNNNNKFDSSRSVPIPHPYAYCTDTSIVGAEFYIMEYVQGRIFVDPRMPSMGSAEERMVAYKDALRVLAVRHYVSV